MDAIFCPARSPKDEITLKKRAGRLLTTSRVLSTKAKRLCNGRKNSSPRHSRRARLPIARKKEFPSRPGYCVLNRHRAGSAFNDGGKFGRSTHVFRFSDGARSHDPGRRGGSHLSDVTTPVRTGGSLYERYSRNDGPDEGHFRESQNGIDKHCRNRVRRARAVSAR